MTLNDISGVFIVKAKQDEPKTLHIDLHCPQTTPKCRKLANDHIAR